MKREEFGARSTTSGSCPGTFSVTVFAVSEELKAKKTVPFGTIPVEMIRSRVLASKRKAPKLWSSSLASKENSMLPWAPLMSPITTALKEPTKSRRSSGVLAATSIVIVPERSTKSKVVVPRVAPPSTVRRKVSNGLAGGFSGSKVSPNSSREFP